jgi:DNA-binding transcriptional ArsR family regulator
MAIQYAAPLDRTFHALGDGTRRAMLGLLARRGECTAGELGAPFDIAQPTASRHLRVLEDAGLVRRTIDGRVHRFRLRAAPLREAERWITRHRRFWNASLDRLEGVLAELERTPPDA